MKKKEVDVEAESAIEAPVEKDDTYDRLVRLTADFDNYRKRVQKEKAELVLYGNENLVRELLPVLDNFERAAEHASKSADVESVRKGVELILSQLKTALERFGVRSESAVEKTFDPLVHEAVSHAISAERPPQTVLEEHQKAYFIGQRLIRPALVTVARAPEEEPAAPPSESDKAE